MNEDATVTADEKTQINDVPKGKMISGDDWNAETNIIEERPAKTEATILQGDLDESNSDNAGDDEGGNNSEQQEVQPVEEPEVEDFIAVQDPGEYQPKDYSFEVSLADGKTVKIKSSEDADDLLDRIDSDPEKTNFRTTKEALNFQRRVIAMEENSRRDKDSYDDNKKVYDEQLEASTQRINDTNRIANELEYLAEKGDLPKVADKYKVADWSDKDIAKQAGVKEHLEVLSYMSKENASRKKLGLAPMTSALDAYNAMKQDSDRKSASDTKTQRATARKQAGARVASSSPAPIGSAPKGIAVGRAGSLRDLDASIGWSV